MPLSENAKLHIIDRVIEFDYSKFFISKNNSQRNFIKKVLEYETKIQDLKNYRQIKNQQRKRQKIMQINY